MTAFSLDKGQLKKRRRGLSLAPLIDVIFILLIFFMLVSQLETHASFQLTQNQNHFDTEINKTTGSNMNQNILRLKSTGTVQFKGRSINLNDVAATFSGDGYLTPNTPLYIRMDGDVTVQTLVSLITQLEKVGGLEYSLIEEQDP